MQAEITSHEVVERKLALFMRLRGSPKIDEAEAKQKLEDLKQEQRDRESEQSTRYTFKTSQFVLTVTTSAGTAEGIGPINTSPIQVTYGTESHNAIDGPERTIYTYWSGNASGFMSLAST